MEIGCVPTDFCRNKSPLNESFVEHECRTCEGVDLCNARFYKPEILKQPPPQYATEKTSTVDASVEIISFSRVEVVNSSTPVSTVVPASSGKPNAAVSLSTGSLVITAVCAALASVLSLLL